MSSVAAKDFKPYRNNWQLVKDYQITDDIMKELLREHYRSAPEYDRECEKFWRGNVKDTAKALYDYCKKNIRYKIEPDKKQTVRTPGAIVSIGSGDCKHYASFINGMLDALKRKGYPVNCKYRFASYNLMSTEPHHVFSVVKDGDNEIWVDPVLKKFNDKKLYFYKQDKTPVMNGVGKLYRVSGGVGMHIGVDDYLNGAVGKKKPKPPKAERKAARKAKGSFLKRTVRTLKKINPAGVAARNSYLLLLKMNLFHLASNIMKKVMGNPAKEAKLKAKWEKMGGNYKVFRQAVTQGAKVWNKHHKNKQIAIRGIGAIGSTELQEMGIYGISNLGGFEMIRCPINGMGVAPAAAPGAAIITAATTIILALRPLLKSLGVSEEKNERSEDAAIEAGADAMLEKAETVAPDGSTMTEAAAAQQTGGAPGVVYSVTDNLDGTKNLNIKDTNFDAGEGDKFSPGTRTDNTGVSNFAANFQNWIVANKKMLIIGGSVVIGVPILFKIVSAVASSGGGTRRRR